jgi:hypothetical protein
MLKTNELSVILTQSDQAVIEWLEVNIDLLHNQAKMLVDDYWRRVNKERKQHPSSDRGRIGVRIRRRAQCYSFTIEWFILTSVFVDGRYKPMAQHLKKGKGFRYPMQCILKNEPEWEALLVQEFEVEFASIRKQIDLFGKFRDAFHHCRRGMLERMM